MSVRDPSGLLAKHQRTTIGSNRIALPGLYFTSNAKAEHLNAASGGFRPT